MTRTVAVGKSDERQREIYQLVLEAQQTGSRRRPPGKAGKEVDADARRVIADAGYGEQFGHGLGHGVGHRGARAASRPLQTGRRALARGHGHQRRAGVYIPGWGGVRIEDLVVVTAQGCRVLTRSPKELIHV